MIVGILGGGQLARMIALAGHPLGLEFICLDPSPDACANAVTTQLLGDYDDKKLLAELAQRADVITYEFENVPADVVAFLAETKACVVYPPAQALRVAQNRLNEKTLFGELDIATADFAAIDTLQDLEHAAEQLGLPAILKTRTEGYDGKGQARLNTVADIDTAWQKIAARPAILEAFIPFEREISIIAARSVSGETACYPVAENVHENGILKTSIVRSDDPMQAQAEAYIIRLLNRLDYVGVLALELFQVGDKLLANECAPRVHNSGHWSSDGAYTCQFENHLRAILDLPLGDTRARCPSAMVNITGDAPRSTEVLSHKHSHLHLYGKAPRPGRKLGHINICTEDEADLNKALAEVLLTATTP